MAEMREVALTVNGRARRAQVEPRRLLVHLLREDLGLTGTHVGCDSSQCGACVVLLDGRAVKSCTLLALQAHGRAVLTIEGLAGPPSDPPSGEAAQRGRLHPLQEAFSARHGLQCGFCTPGMILTALDLLQTSPNPSEQEIRHALHGNLCRCTGYQHIVDAVQEAAALLEQEPPRPTYPPGDPAQPAPLRAREDRR